MPFGFAAERLLASVATGGCRPIAEVVTSNWDAPKRTLTQSPRRIDWLFDLVVVHQRAPSDASVRIPAVDQ